MFKRYSRKPFFLLMSAVGFLLLTAVPGFCGRVALTTIFVEQDIPIATCQELQDMQNGLTKKYHLTCDVECLMTNPSSTGNLNPQLDFDPAGPWGDRKGFMPIGNYTSASKFEGTFDGRGHVIKDLYMNRNSEVAVGLFGSTSRANIHDVGLVNANITSADRMTGSLVGENKGTIRNCYSTGGSVSANDKAGGLVGKGCGTIENSYFTGNVTGDFCTGGLVGYKSRGTIENSYSIGSVSGSRTSGGLVGDNRNGATINNSYSAGSVSGSRASGGLVGDNRNGATINNSYSAGSVSSTGGMFTGGLVGQSIGTVEDSYWDKTTSGWDISDGGTGMLTADMKDEDNFTGWAFESVPADGATWKMDTITPVGNYYPCLNWQANGTCPKQP